MILNIKQTEAKEAIENFLASNSKEFLLTGRAGTGKTTTIKFIEFPYTVIGMALSHKAKEVLFKSLDRPCITVASAIGLEKVENLDTGDVSFLPFGKEIIKDKLIFIVDECSMISEFERSQLLYLYPNSKFIYLGDTYQLPPIKEAVCPIFIDSAIENVELLENMRTGQNSPIMQLLNKLIELQKNVNNITLKDIYNVLPKTNIEITDKALLYNVSIGDMVKKYGNIIIITYHVKKKDRLNLLYRSNILQTTEPFIAGDKIIFNNNIYEGDYKIFSNSEIVTVSDITKTVFDKRVKYYSLESNEVKEQYIDINEDFFILHVEESHFPLVVPKDIEKFNSILTKIQTEAKKLNSYFRERRANWKLYFDLLRAFYDVSYAYAITSHKSQGSTYPVVIVDVNDILTSHMSIQDKLKCLYVACSRASNVLNVMY